MLWSGFQNSRISGCVSSHRPFPVRYVLEPRLVSDFPPWSKLVPLDARFDFGVFHHELFLFGSQRDLAGVKSNAASGLTLIRFSLSTSTCSSLSFPSTSSTPSCTLSSTTRSSWKACATPPRRRVRTPTTSPLPSHHLIQHPEK